MSGCFAQERTVAKTAAMSEMKTLQPLAPRRATAANAHFGLSAFSGNDWIASFADVVMRPVKAQKSRKHDLRETVASGPQNFGI